MEFQKLQRSRILQIIKIFYTPICFLFISYFAWANRIILFNLFDFTDFRLFIVSSVIWGSLHLFAPLGPKIVFASMGISTHYKQLLEIHISRLPARYLPGGIWHTVGRLTDYRSIGISKKDLTLLVVIETFFPCLITFLLGGGYLWLYGDDSNMLSDIEGVLALGSICTIIVLPVIVKWRLSSHVKKNFILLYLLLLLLTVLFWLLASTSFLFYYSSVSLSASEIPLPHIAATYIFSWGVGYISIFAPQGIGVFEVVAGKLMELPMTLGSAVAFLAGFRIVALSGDGLAWIIFRVFSKPIKRV